MNFKTLPILVFLLLIGPAALADEASHRAAAEELLISANMEKLQLQVLGSMRETMEKQLRATPLPEDMAPYFEKVMPRFVDEMVDLTAEALAWDAVKDAYIDIYVAAFTEEEIRELMAFYKTPLGQKMLAKMPDLMRRSMQFSQDRMVAVQPQLMDLVKRMTEAVMAEKMAAEGASEPE